MLSSVLSGGRRTSRESGKATGTAGQVQEEPPVTSLWTEIVKRSSARETFLFQGQQTAPTKDLSHQAFTVRRNGELKAGPCVTGWVQRPCELACGLPLYTEQLAVRCWPCAGRHGLAGPGRARWHVLGAPRCGICSTLRKLVEVTCGSG